MCPLPHRLRINHTSPNPQPFRVGGSLVDLSGAGASMIDRNKVVPRVTSFLVLDEKGLFISSSFFICVIPNFAKSGNPPFHKKFLKMGEKIGNFFSHFQKFLVVIL